MTSWGGNRLGHRGWGPWSQMESSGTRGRPFQSPVTLGQPFIFGELQFPHLQNGEHSGTFLDFSWRAGSGLLLSRMSAIPVASPKTKPHQLSGFLAPSEGSKSSLHPENQSLPPRGQLLLIQASAQTYLPGGCPDRSPFFSSRLPFMPLSDHL